MSRIKRIHWIDMIVKAPERVSHFYSEVLGLQRDAVDEGGGHTSYSLNDAGSEVLGICDEAVFPDWVQGWLPYIDVEDFEASVAKVEQSGGVIVKQMTMDYKWPGQRFCLVRDPSGAPMMLCEAEP